MFTLKTVHSGVGCIGKQRKKTARAGIEIESTNVAASNIEMQLINENTY